MHIQVVSAALAAAFAFLAAPTAAEIAVPVVYLKQEVNRPPVLSNYDAVPEDLGAAGAAVALKDNLTTGGFLGHRYTLDVVAVQPDDDFLTAARAALAAAPFLLLDAAPDQIIAVAGLPEAEGALLFNVASGAAGLRSADCRANLLHTFPEDAARTDALMQLLAARRWTDAVMIIGPKPADAAYAEALRRSAAKFGLRIRAEKEWTFDTDLRDSTLKEVPRFTQDFPDHHVLLVADETDDFGRYVEHNAWLPRPVAGSEGLEPQAWSHVIEAWGAVQLQNRFEAEAGRNMQSQDYAAWLALRAIGEAVTRTNSGDPATLRGYLLSEAFGLDGFKGRALTFRAWNGQLRQPIPVANARALVAMAPLEGFLHQVNETDSLGLDAPESACKAFGD